jgi:PHD/YefM family antitoxin component YafN of YafNO toxin-antitoxin module
MKLKEKYITDENGNRIGVLLDLEEYQKLLEALEELEAIRAYERAISSDDEEIPFEVAIAQIEQSRQ